jgi:hypothetical protein
VPLIIPEEDEPVPVPRQLAVGVVGPTGAGPKPPGLISVAPIGIPVGRLDEVEPGRPSGDVIPMLGVVVTVCAKPTPQLTITATPAMNNRRI